MLVRIKSLDEVLKIEGVKHYQDVVNPRIDYRMLGCFGEIGYSIQEVGDQVWVVTQGNTPWYFDKNWVTPLSLEEYLLEYYVDGWGDLDLTELDFSDFDGDIYISHMSVGGSLIQSNQKVVGDLIQGNNLVKGRLLQDESVADYVDQSGNVAKRTLVNMYNEYGKMLIESPSVEIDYNECSCT